MNHITRLQADLTAAQAARARMLTAIHEFRLHLSGDKFHGTAADGSRKDWIAVTDVQGWIGVILEVGS
jgi:hypothetical protein